MKKLLTFLSIISVSAVMGQQVTSCNDTSTTKSTIDSTELTKYLQENAIIQKDDDLLAVKGSIENLISKGANISLENIINGLINNTITISLTDNNTNTEITHFYITQEVKLEINVKNDEHINDASISLVLTVSKDNLSTQIPSYTLDVSSSKNIYDQIRQAIANQTGTNSPITADDIKNDPNLGIVIRDSSGAALSEDSYVLAGEKYTLYLNVQENDQYFEYLPEGITIELPKIYANLSIDPSEYKLTVNSTSGVIKTNDSTTDTIYDQIRQAIANQTGTNSPITADDIKNDPNISISIKDKDDNTLPEDTYVTSQEMYKLSLNVENDQYFNDLSITDLNLTSSVAELSNKATKYNLSIDNTKTIYDQIRQAVANQTGIKTIITAQDIKNDSNISITVKDEAGNVLPEDSYSVAGKTYTIVFNVSDNDIYFNKTADDITINLTVRQTLETSSYAYTLAVNSTTIYDQIYEAIANQTGIYSPITADDIKNDSDINVSVKDETGNDIALDSTVIASKNYTISLSVNSEDTYFKQLSQTEIPVTAAKAILNTCSTCSYSLTANKTSIYDQIYEAIAKQTGTQTTIKANDIKNDSNISIVIKDENGNVLDKSAIATLNQKYDLIVKINNDQYFDDFDGTINITTATQQLSSDPNLYPLKKDTTTTIYTKIRQAIANQGNLTEYDIYEDSTTANSNNNIDIKIYDSTGNLLSEGTRVSAAGVTYTIHITIKDADMYFLPINDLTITVTSTN